MPAGKDEAGKMVFATWLLPGAEEKAAVMLVQSLRQFGGMFSRCPVWIYAAEPQLPELAEYTRKTLASLDAELLAFPMADEFVDFPFAFKVLEASAAESRAAGKAEFLAWMDPDTIIIQEPQALLLPPSASLGFRPVFLKNISSPYDQPADPFWELIFKDCRVPEGRVFAMDTVVDKVRIRPQFNAGLLVVRPARRLLQAWQREFQRLYQQPAYREFYKQPIYRIFVHQAVLAGVILARLARPEMHEYAEEVNYSIIDYGKAPSPRPYRHINDMVTARYEDFFEDPQWREKLPAQEPLKSWIIKQREAAGQR